MSATSKTSHSTAVEAGLTGADLVVETLLRNGVDTVFGIPGVHTLALYDALHERPMRHILARHEQGAGFMADGYARASGRPGVAFIITGPGVTNVATPVGQAYTDGSPVMIVSSNVASPYLDAMKGNLHDLKNQMAVMEAVTQWNERVLDASDTPAAVAEGLNRLTNGRTRPVHIELPIDVMDERAGAVEIPAVVAQPVPPKPRDIEAAVDFLSVANKVIVYVGGGAVVSSASEAIISIAERFSAPIVSSVMGKGAVPEDHPLFLATIWDRSDPMANAFFEEADTIIVIGSKLGAQATGIFSLPIPERMIRIDIDAEEMERNANPDIAIVADAGLASLELATALAERNLHLKSFPPDRIAKAKQYLLDTGFGADRNEYIQAIRRAMPSDGITVWDMTMMSYVACYRYPVLEPRTFLFPAGYGTLGFALPAALGAKLACPEKDVVAFVGDGGFQFTMQELATAVMFDINIPIVIFDDSTYSAVKDAQKHWREGRYQAVDLVNPDFTKIAEAYGIPWVRAESAEALEQEIGNAFKRDSPTLIIAPIPGWV
jgi:thiamine pyrophosphate-dependent acetolactate synthase large subunit-like protein